MKPPIPHGFRQKRLRLDAAPELELYRQAQGRWYVYAGHVIYPLALAFYVVVIIFFAEKWTQYAFAGVWIFFFGVRTLGLFMEPRRKTEVVRYVLCGEGLEAVGVDYEPKTKSWGLLDEHNLVRSEVEMGRYYSAAPKRDRSFPLEGLTDELSEDFVDPLTAVLVAQEVKDSVRRLPVEG